MKAGPRLVLACLAVVAVAACGSTSTPAPTTPGGSVAPSESAASGASANPAAPSSAWAQAPTPATGQRLLGDTAAGLASLPAYRSTLVQDVGGTLDGQPMERTSRVVYARDAAGDEEWMQSAQQTGADAIERHIVTLDGARYAVGTDGCSGEAVDSAAGGGASEGVVPAALLIPILSATTLGVEEVNGIPATHYRFDASGLPIDPASVGSTTVTGDAWIADPGGYVVRYTLEVTPPAGATGDAATRQSWRYELTTDAAIALPDGCLRVPRDFPQTADATDVSLTSSGLDYRTPSSAREVTAFYWDRLAADGWTLPMAKPPADVGPPFAFTARKGDRATSVLLVAADGGGTDVSVVTFDLAAEAPAPSGAASPAPTSSPKPTAAPTLPNGVPVYPSATEVIQAGSSGVSGLTDDEPKAVLDWYRGKLTKAGWSLEMSSSSNGIEFGQWTKGSAAVMVVASPEDDATRFVVTVQ